jgi:hypothetical protein
MSAIVFDSLEVEIDGVVINKETLKDVVYNDELINKNIRKSVVSQYLLLTDKEHRYEDIITIDGYGTATLYLIEFSGDREDLATNNCVMIRYPYMKIKDLPRISTLPCSAMCIIGDNILNKTLRNVENPQHTNWEFNRIEDESEKQEVKSIYNELIESIKRIITDHLASSDNTKTDIEGAGDYLPGVDTDAGKGPEEKKKVIHDKPVIQKKKVKTKTTNVNASVEDEAGDGVLLDIGENSDDGEETLNPSGHNKGEGGGVRPGPNVEGGKSGDDGHILVKRAELRGMSYRFYCINKKEKKYGVSFTSDFSEKEATFELFALDEGGNRYPVKIYSCTVNGQEVEVIDEYKIKLILVHGNKVKIEMITDQKQLFSGEVKVYAYR